MGVIDFHSHILPGIDDGSRNVETTMRMLEKISEQGVDIQIATPHFYADEDRIDTFLQKRQEAFERVTAIGELKQQILLGAEVAYFDGMSRAEGIERLCIENTNLMLVEMPFVTWSHSVIDDLEGLAEKRNIHIILAHIERFLRIPGNKPFVNEVLDMPLTVQINAEALLDFSTRGKCIKLFKKDKAHILGSDCHGIHHRIPNLKDGRAVISKKLGDDFLNRMDTYGTNLLLEHKK